MLASTLLLSMAFAKPIAPDPRGMAGPDRNFDLQTLHLDLTLVPEEERVFGAARLGVERLFEGPLVLHQVALNIDSVQTDGKKLDWRTQGELLIVEGVGQRAEVEIQYSATPRAGLHFRGGEGTTDTYPEVWSQGENEYNRHWFPSWDYPNDRFVYTGDIKGPEGWKILTNSGVNMVNYLVMVAAAPYDVYGSGLNEVWVAPGTPKEQADAVMEYIPAMHTHFTDRTGVAYPWKNYRQIFVQRFIYGGMENTTATIMNDRYLRTSMFPETNNGPQDVIAHELAHQWYGDLLTCRSWRELWLNEGFATFMASDWHTSILGAEHDAQRVRSWFKSSSRPYTLAGRFHQ
ncbi:MAG: M1 family aminopeptidase, partial [Myxococcota bacterium]|nr:M1 family aminopeptidase [Myxococcota bacterium]